MQKDKGLKKLFKSFGYAFEGLKDSYKTEQTIRIYVPVAIFVILLSIFFKLKTYEWIVIIAILGIILVMELINTSIESVVDLVTIEKKPLAKRAKDIMASAVLVTAIMSVIIGLIIFIPKIILLF